MKYNTNTLKRRAISQTLFTSKSIQDAINKLGFIQADPIRSPARAQDLILRHRVENYKAGDLEKRYPSLPIDEDFLYAYGFIPQELRTHLYPRKNYRITKFEKEVLEKVKHIGDTHPKNLKEHFGDKKVVNGWGGVSAATKSALERLHYAGHLRVTKREKGIRIYSVNAPFEESIHEIERKKKIILTILKILSPVVETTLNQSLSYTRHFLGETRTALNELLKQGIIKKENIDGVNYMFPSNLDVNETEHTEVKFLTPFDPIVWDRKRFEHLWKWQYRFEAYTPKEKRIRGFYAMPLLWKNDVIGWGNLSLLNNKLISDIGYIDKPQTDSKYKKELEKELYNMETFLQPSEGDK